MMMKEMMKVMKIGKANNPIFVVEDDKEVDGGQNGGENIEGSEKEVVEDDQEFDGGQKGGENIECSEKEGVEDDQEV